jgi:hypothetical protein
MDRLFLGISNVIPRRVTVDFVAENQREHMVEHRREKQYLSSLIADLKYDTAQFSIRVRQFEEKFPFFDPCLYFSITPTIQ